MQLFMRCVIFRNAQSYLQSVNDVVYYGLCVFFTVHVEVRELSVFRVEVLIHFFCFGDF